jgi:DNA polymerase-4
LEKRKKLVEAVDKINQRWGEFVITPGRMTDTEGMVIDRIAFGGIKELEEFTFS